MKSAIARGVRNMLVVGSAGGLQPDLPHGSTALILAVSNGLFAAWNRGFDHPNYLEALTRAADIAMDAAGAEIMPART